VGTVEETVCLLEFEFAIQLANAARKGMYPSGYKSPGSTSGSGFDSPCERISQYLTVCVLSLVDEYACVVSVSDVLYNSKKTR
jgi:hypothetical protein